MEIVNAAKHTVADITTVVDKAGNDHLVIVAKATYNIPVNHKIPRPQIPPQPIVTQDIFTGEPGLSAPLYEVDFVRYKPKCDVLFDAYAHAREPVKELDVFVQVGSLKKHINVIGNRRWHNGLSKPEPFTTMPLSFDYAFGGIQHALNGDKEQQYPFEQNLVGMGYRYKSKRNEDIYLPNLQIQGKPITQPKADYQPIALSAVARNWLPRRQYAGTYDAHWRKNVFPFLPDDFDERYFQCAPEDQQIEFPKGGEEVILINMMKQREIVHFKLPRLDNLPIRVLSADYKVYYPSIVVDTLYFEPDKKRFSVVWRASLPIKRRLQEYQTIAIGHVCKEWWQAKIIGADNCVNCSKNNRKKNSTQNRSNQHLLEVPV